MKPYAWTGIDLALYNEILKLESLGIDVDEWRECRESLLMQYKEIVQANPRKRVKYADDLANSLLQLKQTLPELQPLLILPVQVPSAQLAFFYALPVS